MYPNIFFLSCPKNNWSIWSLPEVQRGEASLVRCWNTGFWGDVCNDFERRALEINEKKHRQKLDMANSGLYFPTYLIGDIEDCPWCYNQWGVAAKEEPAESLTLHFAAISGIIFANLPVFLQNYRRWDSLCPKRSLFKERFVSRGQPKGSILFGWKR